MRSPRVADGKGDQDEHRQASRSRWANVEVAWVYELFITTQGLDRFLVEDVLDLDHGRGEAEK